MPSWLDPDTLRWLILVAIGVTLVGMFLVVRFIQKLVTKTLVFAALAGLGLSLWVQREDLQDCVDTCSCSLYGQEVEMPDDRGCS